MDRTLELRIESLAAGGDGVAHEPSGRVVFVPLTAPGDLVRVRLLTSRKRFARGEVTELLEPGPSRTQPPCPVFGTCGGCAWQHVDYDTQIAAKRRIVVDAFRRIGKLDPGDDVPFTPSPRLYGYRNRARLVQEGPDLGYRMRRSHALCAVKECAVLQPELEAVLGQEHPPAAAGGSREWEIAVGTGGAPRAWADDEPGEGAVEIAVGEDRLRVSRGVFAQGNAWLVEALVRAVLREATRDAATTSVLELYAGAGLFTLGLARAFDCAWAVESHPGAVRDLRFNLDRAGLGNVDVRSGTAEEVLPRLSLREPDVVVMDPPRVGAAHEAILAIAELRPRRVVYLSCDPATQARDLGVLRDHGYRLERLEGFDLFPQTPHVEALATFVRGAGSGLDETVA